MRFLDPIIVVGEICEDIIIDNPRSVRVLGEPAWAERIRSTIGGSAAFVASALCHLGHAVEVWGSVGDDAEGRRLLQQLETFGADVTHCQMLRNCHTTRSAVINKQGSKKFIGCSAMLPLPLPDIQALGRASGVYLAGYMLYPNIWGSPTKTLFEAARQKGLIVFFDGQLLPIRRAKILESSSMQDVLPLVDVVLAARKETMQWFGTKDAKVAGQRFLDMGVQAAILKRGEQGARLVWRKLGNTEELDIAPYRVQVSDTVGSGDLFGASMLHGLARGWDYPVSARFANIFAALSLQGYLEHKRMPSEQQVLDLLSQEDEWNE